MDTVEQYTGNGIIFPIKLDSFGAPIVANGFTLLESDLKILLSWPVFTRFYKAEYGSRIEELLEEPNDDITLKLIRRFVVVAIEDWEPRVTLTQLRVYREGKTLMISMSYNITNTDASKSIVFPFYDKIEI